MQTQQAKAHNNNLTPDTCAESAPWEQSHQRMQAAATRQRETDIEILYAILDAQRNNVHVRLGMSCLGEYVATTLRCSRRTANERIRVAKALTYLPKTEAALTSGEVSFSMIKEPTRIATASTEEHWLEAIRGQSVRDIESMVSGRRIGDLPTDRRRPEDLTHKLSCELNAETWALFQDTIAAAEREAGHKLSIDEALTAICRKAQAGPAEEGKASYQLALDVCKRCARAAVPAGGDSIEVPTEILEMALCDAQTIGDPARAHVGSTQTVTPAKKRAVRRRQKNRCVVPGCRNHLFLDVHHIVAAADGGTHDLDNLILLCGVHHRAFHRGYLVIDGIKWDELTFAHADGTRYGTLEGASVRASQAYRDCHEALLTLGFRQTETRQALGRVRAHVGPDADTDEILHAALKCLRGTQTAA